MWLKIIALVGGIVASLPLKRIWPARTAEERTARLEWEKEKRRHKWQVREEKRAYKRARRAERQRRREARRAARREEQ